MPLPQAEAAGLPYCMLEIRKGAEEHIKNSKASQFKFSLEDEIERLEDKLDMVISNLVFVGPDDKNNVKVKVYSIGGKYVGDVDGLYQNGRLNYFIDEVTMKLLKQQLEA